MNWKRSGANIVANSVADSDGGLRVRVVQECDEFVVAVAEQDIASAQTGSCLPHDMANDLITNGTTVEEVNLLQTDNVNEYKRGLPTSSNADGVDEILEVA
jgi:hypothetical protein